MEMNAPIKSNALDVDARGIVGKPLDRTVRADLSLR